ncbi:MAG: type II toxin-antitoxin system RelE/ParE family toxin [Nitrospirales bacterium]|nr:type II toxin-antitoxin system RelE/ParE family toxin [Nitrospirales bacterium]
MSHAVRLSREAEGDLEKLAKSDRTLFDRLLRKIESLAEHPRAGKPLVVDHKGEFSLRVGSYRIVYEMQDSSRTVFILTIKHRKHVY